MEFTEYITRQEQRWDTIAWETYGDPYGYEPILMANPQYRGLVKLPAGTRLQIPVLPEATPTLSAELLPPWKR